jgi:hypothetical protein
MPLIPDNDEIGLDTMVVITTNTGQKEKVHWGRAYYYYLLLLRPPLPNFQEKGSAVKVLREQNMIVLWAAEETGGGLRSGRW